MKNLKILPIVIIGLMVSCGQKTTENADTQDDNQQQSEVIEGKQSEAIEKKGLSPINTNGSDEPFVINACC
ncbi:hypothetical protein [Viscerimonas tarda]